MLNSGFVTYASGCGIDKMRSKARDRHHLLDLYFADEVELNKWGHIIIRHGFMNVMFICKMMSKQDFSINIKNETIAGQGVYVLVRYINGSNCNHCC